MVPMCNGVVASQLDQQVKQQTAAFLESEGVQQFSSDPFDAEGFIRIGAFGVRTVTKQLVNITAIILGTLVELAGLMAGVIPKSMVSDYVRTLADKNDFGSQMKNIMRDSLSSIWTLFANASPYGKWTLAF